MKEIRYQQRFCQTVAWAYMFAYSLKSGHPQRSPKEVFELVHKKMSHSKAFVRSVTLRTKIEKNAVNQMFFNPVLVANPSLANNMGSSCYSTWDAYHTPYKPVN